MKVMEDKGVVFMDDNRDMVGYTRNVDHDVILTQP